MKMNVFFFSIFDFIIYCNRASHIEDDNILAKNKLEITFEERNHEFGPVNIGEKVTHRFIFKNTGKASLIINNVKAGCGCTITHYRSQAVSPGDTSNIKVAFLPTISDLGHNTKSIFIYSNAQNGVQKLTIRAKVK